MVLLLDFNTEVGALCLKLLIDFTGNLTGISCVKF